MINKLPLSYGYLEIVCDQCNFCDSCEADDDFYLLNDIINKNGWRTIFIDNELNDVCPRCFDKKI